MAFFLMQKTRFDIKHRKFNDYKNTFRKNCILVTNYLKYDSPHEILGFLRRETRSLSRIKNLSTEEEGIIFTMPGTRQYENIINYSGLAFRSNPIWIIPYIYELRNEDHLLLKVFERNYSDNVEDLSNLFEKLSEIAPNGFNLNLYDKKHFIYLFYVLAREARKNNAHISIIRMRNNQLKNVDFLNQLLCFFPYLRQLDLSGNPLTSIPRSTRYPNTDIIASIAQNQTTNTRNSRNTNSNISNQQNLSSNPLPMAQPPIRQQQTAWNSPPVQIFQYSSVPPPMAQIPMAQPPANQPANSNVWTKYQTAPNQNQTPQNGGFSFGVTDPNMSGQQQPVEVVTEGIISWDRMPKPREQIKDLSGGWRKPPPS